MKKAKRALEKEKKEQNVLGKNIFKIIFNVCYTILYVFILAILIVVVLQRVSNNKITIGGYRMFTVVSGSMVPKYQISDVLLSKAVPPSELQEGDDISYLGEKGTFAGKIVTHQIKDISQNEDGTYRIITKGIANSAEDPEITDSQVFGKIVFKFRILSYIGNAIQNMYVFYFLVFVPIGIIIFKWIRAFELRKDED